MAGRGRPRGTEIDDSARIAQIRRLLAADPNMSRRQAILAVVGPDQQRRIEIKMARSGGPAVAGLDEALEGRDMPAVLAAVERAAGGCSPLERDLLTWAVGHAWRETDLFASILGGRRSGGSACAGAMAGDVRINLDHAYLALIAAAAWRDDGYSDEAGQVRALLSRIPDYVPALGPSQRGSHIGAWNAATERLRGVFHLPPARPHSNLPRWDPPWPVGLCPDVQAPPLDFAAAEMAAALGEPNNGVVAMPLHVQAFLAQTMWVGFYGEQPPEALGAAASGAYGGVGAVGEVDRLVAALGEAWGDRAFLRHVECACAASGWTAPAVLHAVDACLAARDSGEPFWVPHWLAHADPSLYQAVSSAISGHPVLPGLGAFVHWAIERRAETPLIEPVFGPACRVLGACGGREATCAEAEYWTAVDAALEERADDGWSAVVDPENLTTRGWTLILDQVPFLTRWLASAAGRRFLRERGGDDPVDRAAVALSVRLTGALPDLQATWLRTRGEDGRGPWPALLDVALDALSRPVPAAVAWRGPGDLDGRRRLLAALASREAVAA